MDTSQDTSEPQKEGNGSERKVKEGGMVKRVLRRLGKNESSSTKKRTWKEEGGGKDESTKKVRKPVNPFTIPPNKMDFNLLQIRNPFITIVMSDEGIRLEEDKIMDGRNMDADALFAAMSAMVPTTIEITNAFSQPSSESGGRPYHIGIASGFRMITRPCSTIEKIVTVKEILQKTIESCAGFTPPSCSVEEEDLQIDVAEEDVAFTGCESVESLEIKHECDEGDLKLNEAKYDLNFMVYDKLIAGPDKKVTKLIVDCKWEDVSIKGICQVSMYGLQYAISNMEKGKYCPIYLEVWGERLWRYAILFPAGIIKVEDGKVNATSGSGFDIEDIQKILSNKQVGMRGQFPDAMYPDDSYVQGVLYISREKFALPHFAESCGGDLDAVKRFYQSKIRILVGDKALEWTETNVKEIVALREEEKRRKVAEYLRART